MAKSLTVKEIRYLEKACQNLSPDKQEEAVLQTLVPKLKVMLREATLGEAMFGIDAEDM